MTRDNYDTEISAIVKLSALRPTDPMASNPPYITHVLAMHRATNRVQLFIEAKNQQGINKFLQDYPNAGVIQGDGTPDNHDEWEQLAFPTQVNNSTSPVEIFKRGHIKLAADIIKERRFRNGR